MDVINIIFKGLGGTYIYESKRNELLSSVVEKLKKDSGIYYSEFRFIRNGNFLDLNKTLEENAIPKGGIINVIANIITIIVMMNIILFNF